MSADIIRHPRLSDQKNARNRAAWYRKYHTGVHCADLRDEHAYRQGEWIALQAHWLRQGYRFLDRPVPEVRASRARNILRRVLRGQTTS